MFAELYTQIGARGKVVDILSIYSLRSSFVLIRNFDFSFGCKPINLKKKLVGCFDYTDEKQI